MGSFQKSFQNWIDWLSVQFLHSLCLRSNRMADTFDLQYTGLVEMEAQLYKFAASGKRAANLYHSHEFLDEFLKHNDIVHQSAYADI